MATRLSQGLKKRVAIDLMLIRDADLYYFDEPTNGLDPEMLIILKGIIHELNNQKKTANYYRTYFFDIHNFFSLMVIFLVSTSVGNSQ